MEPFNFRSEKLRQAVELAELNPQKYTPYELAEQTGLTYDQITAGLRRAGKKYLLRSGKQKPVVRPRGVEYIPPPPNTENVMVIGDLHEPFTLDGYREFCIATAKKYKITHVIFIGDIIDSHGWSYHEHDPDGMSSGDELSEAIENISLWNKAFPEADVVLGNHDRLVRRKVFTGNIPKAWVMDFKDVLGTPRWNFRERVQYEGVQYIHGEGGTARTRARKDLMSTVQGHLHPQAYTEHLVGQTYYIFAMQVGCGVDRKAYAFEYAKDHPKPAIGVGVILNHGELAFNLLMPL